MTRVVVVGDALLDVDVDAAADRLVPDTAAPVLHELARRARPGGAALAAWFAAADCDVVLVTALEDDDDARTLRDLLAATGRRVEVVALGCDGATAVKTRLRRGAQTVARLDRGSTRVRVLDVPDAARRALESADAVLVSDYGRGTTADDGVRDLLAAAAATRPVVWDPHPRGADPVRGVRLLTPNAGEAAGALGHAHARGVSDACRQARALRAHWQAAAVAVTLGSRGAVLADGSDTAAVFPPPLDVSGDACGAGDRFAARAVTVLAGGALTSEAVAAAVDSATAFLADGGVATLDLAGSGGAGDHLLAADDVATGPDTGEARAAVQRVRARGGTVVATGGCFDLLHPGHVRTLEAARALGDCLVVCLNSDASVRRRKGPDRPVQSVADRERVLRALAAVDAVAVFDEDTPEQVLDRLRPDVWVKGGDYAGADLPETALVRSWGGEVVTVPYLPGRSTSELLTRARR